MEYKILELKAFQQKQFSKILIEVYFNSFTKNNFIFPYTLRNKYLSNLKDLRKFIKNPSCRIYVAISKSNKVLGGVFYCSNTKEYGLKLTNIKNKTCAIRYLAIKNNYRNQGIAKNLIEGCINQAKKDKNKRIILHTLESMKEASNLYERYGFRRFKDIDFRNINITVKGYKKSI